MLNNLSFVVISTLFFIVIFYQFYKLAVRNAIKDGAATILLQFIAGFSILLLSPLFQMQFPQNIEVYGWLLLACIFYAINDRLQTTARKHLQVSLFSIVNQLQNVFLILIGLTIFREQFLLSKILGAAFILLGNILLIYTRGKLQINKYIWVAVAANFSFAIAMSTDIGISKNFNLPFYISLTLIIPAIIILLAERIPIKDVVREYKNGIKKYFLITGIAWGLAIFFSLRSFQLANVTLIVPLQATSVLLNVIVAYLFLHERSHILKKVVAALFVIAGVFFTVQGF